MPYPDVSTALTGTHEASPFHKSLNGKWKLWLNGQKIGYSQGSQPTSIDFTKVLLDAGIQISMDGRRLNRR